MRLGCPGSLWRQRLLPDIQVHCQIISGVILNWTAGCFFYTFWDCVWTSDTSTQRITGELYNYHFQNELQDRSLRTIATRGLLPVEAANISEGHSAAALSVLYHLPRTGFGPP